MFSMWYFQLSEFGSVSIILIKEFLPCFVVCLHYFFNNRSMEQALEDQRQLRTDLQSDVGCSKDRVQEIQKQLDDVLEQLGDARIDKHEDARRKKKQEIVERFKSNYSGVVSVYLICDCGFIFFLHYFL